MPPIHAHLQLLDTVQRNLDDRTPGEALPTLFNGLQALRASSQGDEWDAFRKALREHPVLARVHQDPMTRRSYEQPRGYAGDAVLLDYIYRLREPEEAGPETLAIYDYAVGRAAARAVRHRREWLAYLVDRAADRWPRPARVLSVACGHLREAEDSAAITGGWLEEFVALDGDARSLAVVEERNLPRVTTVERTILRLLARPKDLGTFAFAYSAGLYDYLDESLGSRLTACLFDRLEPGGTLVFSNFLPTVPDAGYMESLMGWDLIYRDLQDLQTLTKDIPEDELASVETYADPFGAIGYMEIKRRG